MKLAYEVNFDGIVGPTHNYSGLSYGNIASEASQFSTSNPQEAALQGLEKMKFLADKGIKQAVLPPHERPFFPILRQLGFEGSPQKILKEVQRHHPELLLAVSSAAAMWTANAATVSPSVDSKDHRLHLTPANLSSKFHRSIESETTSAILQKIFPSSQHFTHHPALPAGTYFSDEGAANHLRFCRSHGEAGIQLFIFGRYAFQKNLHPSHLYPARQTYEASQAITRLHALDPQRVFFAQQNPEAIDAGAFHNDVVSVANENVFFFHEQAFLEKEKLLFKLKEAFAKECQTELICIEVNAHEISLKEAVACYLFNSQLITLQNGSMMLLAPTECEENPKIKDYIDSLVQDSSNPIQEVHYINLRQSMRNGGGPACLRIRIAMTQEEIKAAHQAVFLTEELYQSLKGWIKTYYRDRLTIQDFGDPTLVDENREALDQLIQILNLKY